jgi:hypothetical protein
MSTKLPLVVFLFLLTIILRIGLISAGGALLNHLGTKGRDRIKLMIFWKKNKIQNSF